MERYTLVIALTLLSATQLLADGRRFDLHGDPLPKGAIARLGTQRLRHPSSVRDVIFVPDGKTLLTRCADSKVRRWNAVTGRIVDTFDLGTSGVDRIVLSPDKTRLAIGGGQRIEIYDLLSGKRLQRIALGLGRIDRLHFSRDGAMIVSHSSRYFADPHAVVVHDTATGRELLRLQDKQVSWADSPAQFALDGSLLLHSTVNDSIDVWRIRDRRKLRTLKQEPYSAPWWLLADGQTVVSLKDAVNGPKDARNYFSRVTVWNLRDKGPPRKFTMPKPVARKLEYRRQTLLLGSIDGEVRLVDLARKTRDRSMRCYTYQMGAMALSADGRKLVTTGTDSEIAGKPTSAIRPSIRIWDLEKFERVCELPLDDANVRIAWSPDGRCLATLRDGKTTRGCTTGGDGTQMWFGNSASALSVLHKLPSGKRIAHNAGSQHAHARVAFSPNSRFAAAFGNGPAVRVWRTSTGRETVAHIGHHGAIQSVSLSGNGSTALSLDENNSIRVWDVATQRQRHHLPHHGMRILDTSLSPDGQYLAACETQDGWKEVIRVWDFAKGTEVIRLGHAFHPFKWSAKNPSFALVSFSRNGDLLVCGSHRGSVLWRLKAEQLRALRKHRQSSSRSGIPLVKLNDVAHKQKLPRASEGSYEESTWFVSRDRMAFLYRNVKKRTARLQLYETRIGGGKQILEVSLPAEADVHFVAADRTTLAFASGEPRKLHVWDTQSKTRLRSQVFDRTPTAVALSPGGKYMAIACVSKSVTAYSGDTPTAAPVESAIEIRDVTTGRIQAELAVAYGKITSLAYSADGRRIISGGTDTTTLIWDSPTVDPRTEGR